MNLGYACINMTLSNVPKKKRVTTNRSMIRKTFDARGIKYASELALQNVTDLETIFRWNEKNGFKFFRMSSDIFPWASEYELEQLPDFEKIAAKLARCGAYATKHGHRITFHPGPFNKLTSFNERVTTNTIKDLRTHGEVFDLMGLSRTPYNKINIHVGAHYNDKPSALANFCRNFDRLPDCVKQRLTVENDDKASLYSTAELYEGVFLSIGIPIVFDFHHHKFCTGDMTEEEALSIAAMTWGKNKPVVHYSESKCDEYNIKCRPQAHSDYVNGPINTYGIDVDVMVEAKAKELAVLRLKSAAPR
jgi:UV DNA damage endonuclease